MHINITFTAAGTTVASSGALTIDYSTVHALTAGQYSVNSAGGGSTAAKITFGATVTGAVTINYSSAVSSLWGDDNSLLTDTDKLNDAITSLRTQASTMAANLSVITTRQDWSQGMINNLQTGADNLTLADMNEEGANMLALQTRQQLGIQALSLASQANQSVMRLFG
jgi:flagellin